MKEKRDNPQPLGPICNKVIEELGRLIGPELVRVYGGLRDCTIDTKRPDVIRVMKERGKSEWIGSYGSGSVWISEETRRMEAGDIVVPLELKDMKIREMKDYGCTIEEVHEYKDFGVSHIHGVCPIIDPRRFARLVAKSGEQF